MRSITWHRLHSDGVAATVPRPSPYVTISAAKENNVGKGYSRKLLITLSFAEMYLLSNSVTYLSMAPVRRAMN